MTAPASILDHPSGGIPRFGRPARPLVERFWEKVDVGEPTECWNWKSSWRSKFGYGRIRLAGRGSRDVVAHRLAYELTVGPLRATDLARHMCDNPACCNPAHIIPGTHSDNLRDQYERGRR